VRRAAVLLAGVLLASCATTTTAPPTEAPSLPEGEEYTYPTAVGLSSSEQKRFDKAWRAILAGQVEVAEKELAKLLTRRPSSPALVTAVGYAHLRAGRAAEALTNFKAATGADERYVPALVGAASAQAKLGDVENALAAWLKVREIAPGEPSAAAHVQELRLQVTDRRVGLAQQALAAGQRDEAIRHYQTALAAAPEVGGVRLELANLLFERGDGTNAIALLRGDPAGDPALALRAAQMLAATGDQLGALQAYEAVLARDPYDAEARAGASRTRQHLELLRMPEEYRAIFGSPRIDRADLAALVSVKVQALSRARADAPAVAVDISGSWAREHILRSLSYGLFDLFPNHTFQPMGTVRRSDLAVVLQRILDRMGVPPVQGPAVVDVPRTSPMYYPVSRTVGSGLMALTPGGAFEPWRPVSGEEAAQAIDALVRRLSSGA
jgi:tetratricopeptide (TPR) repeat protein